MPRFDERNFRRLQEKRRIKLMVNYDGVLSCLRDQITGAEEEGCKEATYVLEMWLQTRIHSLGNLFRASN